MIILLNNGAGFIECAVFLIFLKGKLLTLIIKLKLANQSSINRQTATIN